MKDLIVQLEMLQETKELRELGLSEMEIEGYFSLFIDTYFPEEKETNDVVETTQYVLTPMVFNSISQSG